jgi:RimJ/RimL family protein N-acetyltransferase
MTVAQFEEIDRIERLAAKAWPAEHVEHRSGWRFRVSAAPNRRVNSILPLYPAPPGALADRIALVETFYRERNLRPRFQISPAVDPPDLDAELAARGYVIEAPVSVQIASVGEVAVLPKAKELRLESWADEAWLATSWPDGTTADMAARRALLERIRPDRRFATVVSDATPIAVGLGVLDGEWLGIFCMRTILSHRRRGAASEVLAALSSWAMERGARSVYLQVETENLPALGLYARVGFRTLYGYHYRSLPA